MKTTKSISVECMNGFRVVFQRPTARELLNYAFIKRARKTTSLQDVVDRHNEWRKSRPPSDDSDEDDDDHRLLPVCLIYWFADLLIADLLVDWLIASVIGNLFIYWLTNQFIYILVYWLIDWIIDWFIG